MKKHLALFVVSLFLISGCATGRNYQPDIDVMNTKIASLQNQLENKNREIAELQDQNRALMTQLELANRAKQDAEERLYEALDKLAKSSGSSSTKQQGYIK